LTADDNNSIVENKWLYVTLHDQLGFEIDIRDFKIMNVRCKSKTCEHSSKPFGRKVQAGVDVALAVKMLEWGFSGAYNKIVMIAGDGDFYDAVVTLT
jgi:uncharacterized LabA/DUF88 family protein